MPHGMSAVCGAVFHNAGKTWNIFTMLHWTGLPRLMMSSVKNLLEDTIAFQTKQFTSDFILSFFISKRNLYIISLSEKDSFTVSLILAGDLSAILGK